MKGEMKDERDNEHHTDQKKHKEIPKQTHTRGGTSADHTGRAARPQRHGQADLAVYRSEKPW